MPSWSWADVQYANASYRLSDYLLCFFLYLFSIILSATVSPHCRTFNPSDPSISHPYAGAGTFPTWTLPIIAIVPALIYAGVECVAYKQYMSESAPARVAAATDVAMTTMEEGARTGGTDQQTTATQSSTVVVSVDVGTAITPTARHTDRVVLAVSSEKRHMYFVLRAHYWVLTQAFSVALAMVIVDTTKLYAGRLRPDFLDRLTRAGLDTSYNNADSTYWCDKARDGRKSFPSGHSAISFAAFVPLCCFCMSCLQVWRRAGSYTRLTIGLLPLALPIMVAVSRTRDYRHFFDDVVAGAVIGSATAVVAVLHNFEVDHMTGRLFPHRLRSPMPL